MENKRKYLVISIVLMIVISIVGTFAWVTWRSSDTGLVLTIGEIDKVQVVLSPYDLNLELAPVVTYTGEDYVSVKAVNNTNDENLFSLYYDIESIDSGLVSSNMKYMILRSNTENGTYEEVEDGNFLGTSNGTSMNVLDEVVPANTTYYYKVYTYYTGSTANLELKTKIKAYINGYVFNYTGNVQTFNVPFDGYYQLEVWGAQGGGVSLGSGGYGGYSTGFVYLNENDNLYVVVGGQGGELDQVTNVGGYNGGGYSGNKSPHNSFGGGGATHIATTNRGILANYDLYRSELLIVAGGGGGGAARLSSLGGSGGGYIGASGTSTDSGYNNSLFLTGGGTQNGTGNGCSLNKYGSFGTGTQNIDGGYGGGGGGGYYGGSTGTGGTGSGGSGYIGNTNLYNKVMYCYNCIESNVESIRTVNTNSHGIHESRKANTGNGYAKITYVGTTITIVEPIDDENEVGDIGSSFVVENFDYTGSEQTLIIPVSGYYKLETWGAQGGSYNTTYRGGYGGYSVGTIYLDDGDILYINVGGAGVCSGSGVALGGYNGGGGGYGSNCSGTRYGCSGGGATHIAILSGVLKNLPNLGELLIVSGGGSGSFYFSSGAYGPGADAGGYVGNMATWTNGSHQYYGQAQGGTQNAGGLGGYSYKVNTNIAMGLFGLGGSWCGYSCSEGSGGGGGYYGGGTGEFSPGGGGSGYIGDTNLTDKHMYCYNCQASSDESIKTISGGTSSCHNSVATTDCAKEGNGYVRITYLSS